MVTVVVMGHRRGRGWWNGTVVGYKLRELFITQTIDSISQIVVVLFVIAENGSHSIEVLLLCTVIDVSSLTFVAANPGEVCGNISFRNALLQRQISGRFKSLSGSVIYFVMT
jgi:hypothetical protein